jgi:hypothetical protein
MSARYVAPFTIQRMRGGEVLGYAADLAEARTILSTLGIEGVGIFDANDTLIEFIGWTPCFHDRNKAARERARLRRAS